MLKILNIGKSVYLVDPEDKSYRLLRRNKDWLKLTKEENKKHKKLISGFTRIYTNDKTKKILSA